MKRLIAILAVVLMVLILPAYAQDEISCGDPYEGFETFKPPLNIEALPKPSEELFVHPRRVIGYAFSDGSLAYVATVAAAECTVAVDGTALQVGGVIWAFAGTEVEQTIVTAFDLEGEVAYLLDESLSVIDTAQASLTLVETPPNAENVPPIDVSLPAWGVCYTLGVGGDYVRACAMHELVAANQRYEDKFQQLVINDITEAQSILQEALGFDIPISTQVAVSEIEGTERIGECVPGEPESSCVADLLAAPVILSDEDKTQIAAGLLDARLLQMLGILVVREPIQIEAYNLSLQPGWYALEVAGQEIPGFEAVMEGTQIEATLTGQTMNGEPVEGEPVQVVVAPFVSPDDAGLVEIVGLKIFYWCIGECR